MSIGETNLSTLIKSMKPSLNDGEYVFCTMASMVNLHLDEIVSFFRESEGITVIVPKQVADKHGLAYSSVFSWLTLKVHSSLEAVGLTAAISSALAAASISCNVVAAYYHDHIFVGKDDAQRSLEVLERLSQTGL